MKRQYYLRLFIVVLVTGASVMLFSYVRARNSRPEEPCNEGGKCPGSHGGSARTEYILWESLTHNFLTANN
jgi:hypothetical protein